MKPNIKIRIFLILAGSSLLAVSHAHAAPVTWDINPGTVGTGDSAVTGGTGAWIEDLTTGNWTTDGGVNNIAWVNANNDTAVFGDTAGTVTIDAAGITVGGLQFDSAGYTISGGALTFGAAGSITANADATISAPLAGSAAISKDGTGILILSGASTSYTGALTLNAGTVRANTSADALGSGAATLGLNGGTLVFNNPSALAFNRNTTVTADTTIQSSRDVAGAGLTYTLGTLGIGANKLTIGAGVTTSGTAALTFGATTLSGNATFEVINGAGSTGQLTLGAVAETGGARNLTKEGGGVLDLSASNSYSGATLVSGGVLRLSNTTSLPGGIAVAGGASALTLNGGAIELASDDFLRNLGAGAAEVQIPGGSSGFSARGAARIVNLNNDAHQITWGSATFNPATFVLNASTANNTLNFQNPIDLGGGSRTISVAANTATLSGIVSNGGLIKTGAGTLALPANNTYSGGTTLNGGTVAISNANSFGSNSVSVTGSSRINSTAGNGIAITYANAIDVGAALSLQNPQTATGATATFSGQLTGSSAITIVNGGGNGLLAGLAFTNTNNTFTGDVIMPSGSVAGDDRFIFNSIGDGGKFTFRKRGHQSAFIYSGTSAITFNTRQIAFAADFGGSPFDGGGVTPVNRFMNNATDPAHTVTFNTSITPATVHASSSGYLFFDGSNTGNNTFAGTIPNMSNQNLNIGKNGVGKWILTGSNTYTGTTLIANGTLSVGAMDLVANAQPLGKGTIIQLGNSSTNGTLEYTGSGNATTDKQIVLGNPTNNNQSGAGSIVNNSTTGTLTFSNPTFISIAGVTLTTRDRTLTLGGSNVGLNTISGTIQDNNPVGTDPARVLLTKTGDGTWMLSGTNTYSGGTTVSAGTLVLSGNNTLLPTTGNLTLNGGTLRLVANVGNTSAGVSSALGYATGSSTGNANPGITTGGTVGFQLRSDLSVTFAGTSGIGGISGRTLNIDVDNNGSGSGNTITFSPNGNVYGGNVTVNITGGNGYSLAMGDWNSNGTTGTLTFNPTTASVSVGNLTANIGTPARTVALDGTASSNTIGAITSVNYSLTKSNTSTWTLTGANTYSGNTTASAGTLVLADNAQLKFVLGATSGTNNSIVGAGTVTLDGDFVIDTSAADALPSGTWTLENVDTLTGPYGSTFTVVGFTDAGSNKWTKVNGSKLYTFDETTGILTLAASGGNYASWATANGINGEPFGGDFDNDGISNGVEYALGLNPITSSQPAGVLSGNTITFTKGTDAIANDDVTWIIETSETLAPGSWTDEVTQSNTNNDPTISYTFTPGTPSKKFARLKAVKAP